MSSIVFWQNTPSIHQAPLIREIAKISKKKIVVVALSNIDPQRVKQGWNFPDYGDATLVVQPKRSESNELLSAFSSSSDTHIFSGIHAYPEIFEIFKLATKSSVTMGLYVEPGATHDGWKAVVRRLIYKIQALRWSKRLEFIFATGQIGFDWYRKCGFDAQNIYKFGYFIDEIETQGEQKSIDLFEIVFVGEISSRKGIDNLISAMYRIHLDRWRLRIIGSGELQTELSEYVSKKPVNGRIEFLGNLANKDAKNIIGESDLLVLPSRFDGWGAVINEALAAGTPVIVSNKCGASELVVDDQRGQIFNASDVDDLTYCLKKAILNGKITQTTRMKNIEWAGRAISPKVAAKYFLEVIDSPCHERPRNPPWRVVEFENLNAEEVK